MIELMNSSRRGKKAPKFDLLSSAAINVGTSRPITFQRNGYIYAYGDAGTTFFKTLQISNPIAWNNLTINNNNTDGYGGVISDSFVMGFGVNGGQTRTFARRFLLASNAWTTNPTAPSLHGTASAYGTVRNRLYSFGSTSSNMQAMHYDLVANAWTNIPNTSNVVGRQGAAGGDGTNMYCLAGFTVAPNLNPADFWRINYADNTWTKLASLKHSLYSSSQLCYLNGKLYCIGGVDSTIGSKLSFVAYDIATDTWDYLQVPGTITGDVAPGLVTDGTYLYYVSYQKNQVWKITV